MRGLSFAFLVCGIVAVLTGMGWGIHMAVSGDHSMAPAHAHLNLLGWVSFSIYAIYYHLVPSAAESRLAKVHFALALGGLIVFVPGIAIAISRGDETLAKAGSLTSMLAMLTFLVIVVRSRGRAA